MTNIIELAAQRGSTATTRAGAMRYLLAHLARPSAEFMGRKSQTRTRKQYDDERYERRAARIAAAIGVWDRSAADALADELSAVGRQTHAWPYRVSQSPGARQIRFDISSDGVPHFSHVVKDEWGCYSSRCKYPAKSETINLSVTAETACYFPTLICQGLMVIDARRFAPREFAMTWLEQGRGLSEKIVRGYYLRGRHIVADSIESARKKMRSMRRAAARSQWETRVIARVRKLSDKQFDAMAARAWVTREDSIAVGNCVPATESFARIAAEAVGAPADSRAFALRGDVLLSMRRDSYTIRAVSHALLRVKS